MPRSARHGDLDAAAARRGAGHAAKFIAHTTDRGARPQIGAIPAPNAVGGGVLEVFEASLAHERAVSESIRNLDRLAPFEGDVDVVPLLHWLIEEEATGSKIVGRVKLNGDDGGVLLRLDTELGSRSTAW